MKKPLIILFMFFVGIYHVIAEENTFWTDEQISNSNYNLISQEVRYKWYKETTIYSDDYYIEGDNPEAYPYKIDDNNILTDFSDWSSEYRPETKPNRTIEMRSVYKYRILKPVRYILFHNFIGGFMTFRLNELNVLIDGKEIDYVGECSGCINPTYYNDGNVDGFQTSINNGGNLKIDLGNYYSIGSVRLELYLYDSVPSTKKVDIYMDDNDTSMENSFIHKTFETSVVSQTYGMPERHLLIPDETWVARQDFMDWTYTSIFYNATYYRQMMIDTEFRWRDIIYRHYGISREYADDYFSELNDSQFIKDLSQSKNYYLYQKCTDCSSNNNQENTNDDNLNNNQNDNGGGEENNDVNNSPNNNGEDNSNQSDNDTIENEDNEVSPVVDKIENKDTSNEVVDENNSKDSAVDKSEETINSQNHSGDNRQITVNKISKSKGVKIDKIFNYIPDHKWYIAVLLVLIVVGITAIAQRKKVKSVV